MRKCSICGKGGHNSRTCSNKDGLDKYVEERNKREPGFKKLVEKEKEKLKTKRIYRCKKCGGIGHQARKCKLNETQNIPKGHQILIEQKKKVPRQEINGIRPKKGLWLIQTKRKRIAGQIKYIKRKGQIVWEDNSGVIIESDPNIFIKEGYELKKICPWGNNWKRLGLHGWR